MHTRITREGQKVVLSCGDGDRILLSPERAETTAGALLRAHRVVEGDPVIVLEEQRGEGYTLVVVAHPGQRAIAVGNVGPRGDGYAGFEYGEAKAAAAEILAINLDIERNARKKREKKTA